MPCATLLNKEYFEQKAAESAENRPTGDRKIEGLQCNDNTAYANIYL